MVAARYIEERYLNPLRAKRIKREEEAMRKIREEARAQGTGPRRSPGPQTQALGHALARRQMGNMERTAAGR